MKRSFLFLQGAATPFFTELGKALIKEGHQVLKVNFCGGDLFSGQYFSKDKDYLNYTDSLEKLPAFYKNTISKYNITNILLFGDTRPIHQSAIELAKQKNIELHVFEEGYFRPNWITLDEGGVNANSSLSKNPQWHLDYRNSEKNTSIINDTAGGNLAIRAWHDIRYHAANLFFSRSFPHYKSHRPDRALKEYWGWIKRMPLLWFFYNGQSKSIINKLVNDNKSYYLLPLQLNADSQMKVHSSIQSVSEVIQLTIESFALHAPKDTLLVIKNHPLDPWFVNYRELINQEAVRQGINKNRIIYIESGDLIALLKKTKGVVLVNSTVGNTALAYNCAVIALGKALYDIKGLTFQDDLDDFWLKARPPDKELFEAFQYSIIKNTQINGGFYNQKGIKMAVSGSVKKLTYSISD